MNDGIVNGRFCNPHNAGGQGWDYGFWFRSDKMSMMEPIGYYAITLRSDQIYRLLTYVPVSRGYSQTEVQRGPIRSMRTGADEANDVELRALGAEGVLSVNGYEIARLDLHQFTDEGPVSILTAMSVPSEAGTEVRYENFTVASLTTGL